MATSLVNDVSSLRAGNHPLRLEIEPSRQCNACGYQACEQETTHCDNRIWRMAKFSTSCIKPASRKPPIATPHLRARLRKWNCIKPASRKPPIATVMAWLSSSMCKYQACEQETTHCDKQRYARRRNGSVGIKPASRKPPIATPQATQDAFKLLVSSLRAGNHPLRQAEVRQTAEWIGRYQACEQETTHCDSTGHSGRLQIAGIKPASRKPPIATDRYQPYGKTGDRIVSSLRAGNHPLRLIDTNLTAKQEIE